MRRWPGRLGGGVLVAAIGLGACSDGGKAGSTAPDARGGGASFRADGAVANDGQGMDGLASGNAVDVATPGGDVDPPPGSMPDASTDGGGGAPGSDASIADLTLPEEDAAAGVDAAVPPEDAGAA